MISRTLALLLCVLSLTPAGAQIQLVRGSQNHLLAPVHVNGRPASFLVDTGSPVTLLQSDRVAQFRVRSTVGEVPVGPRKVPGGRIDELRIGPVSLGAVDVGLISRAQSRGPIPGRGGKSADGLLGLDVLRRYRAVINCRTQQLFLNAGADLGATTRSLGFRRIQIYPTPRGFLSVPCSIGGRAGALYIDTGAFVTVLNERDVRALSLEGAPSKLSARTPAGRVSALQLTRVRDLRIGDVVIPPQRFAVMDLFPDRRPARTFTGMGRLEFYDLQTMRARRGIWGLLGAELLYLHHAIIDLGSMSLFLK